MNFGDFKTSIDKLMIESLTKEDTTSTKEYFNILNNENIKKQYNVYSQIEESYIEDRSVATSALQKMISDLPPFISSYNFVDKTDNELYEAIDIIRQPIDDLTVYSEKFNKVLDHLQTDKKLNEQVSVSNVDMKFAISLIVEKFNQKYKDVLKDNPSLRNVFESIFNNYEIREKVFDDTKDEMLSKVNEGLSNNPAIDLKTDLLSVKEKLLEMTFNSDSYITDIVKMKSLEQAF